MNLNPIKTLKNSLLVFVRYFYEEETMYIGNLIDQWIKSFVRFVLDTFYNGFMFWLFLMGLIIIFSVKVNLGPGYWHLLHIFLLGIIIYFLEKVYKTIRGNKK